MYLFFYFFVKQKKRKNTEPKKKYKVTKTSKVTKIFYLLLFFLFTFLFVVVGYFVIFIITAREMGVDENSLLRLLDENLGHVETPLVASSNSHYLHHQPTAVYPYNVTGFPGNKHNEGGNGPNESRSHPYTYIILCVVCH